MKKKDLLQEALKNIREYRKTTEDLLVELQKEITAGEATHSRTGIVAAKYVETLQRSNEQLVKIIAQLSKQQKTEEDLSLSESEKDNIFKLIQESV